MGNPYANAKKAGNPSEFKWVRSIYGKGEDAIKKYNYIPSDGMNAFLDEWHKKQPQRKYDVASPSRITTCPRVIWLKNHNVPIINDMGWGVKQRMMAGRMFEDLFASQLKDAGMLLHHWKDNPGDKVDKFVRGEGIDRLEGVPDYILQLNKVAVSDAKTSRSDSFGYVPMYDPEIWTDWGYYKYRVQLTAYFMLCHANKEWFEKNKIPLPEICHLFVYALDDGIIRREFSWTPTKEDMENVVKFTRRFNGAVASKTMPSCTCVDTFDNFDVKFCDYGVKDKGTDKIAARCCGEDLIKNVQA